MTAAALQLQHPRPAHHHQWPLVLLMLPIRHQLLQPAALQQPLPVVVMTSRVGLLGSQRQMPLLQQLRPVAGRLVDAHHHHHHHQHHHQQQQQQQQQKQQQKQQQQ
jgi:hypothetical protein